VKQILQSARTGDLDLVEVPTPVPEPGQVLVRNRFSVVSPGTEGQSLTFARMSLLAKARARPDLVAQVRRKLREEGPLPTYRTVLSRLESPQPLGYSCAGVVEAAGAGVTRFAPGDRVACGGAGYANHAEFVVVPENLVARVPDALGFEQAAFATLGAIALQGLRVAQPTLGEIAVVVGLGLIGQLTLQLLRANGCRVLGVDLEPARVQEALEQGAEWAYTTPEIPPTWKLDATEGHGADFAVVAASSPTAAPLALAAELCRHKGRISLVGAMPMELDRRAFYDKELELRMSTSYGPGRYDRSYEERGQDYPLPYVRWTENRNLQAFLHCLAAGQVRTQLLATETIPFADALGVYDDLAHGRRKAVALIFEYPEAAPAERRLPLRETPAAPARETLGVAFVGAGNYARGVLLPALSSLAGIERVALVTATGASARRTSEKFGFASCGTDPELAFADPRVDLVFVATRHDSHAELAVRALRAGKAVWLEKPVGLRPEEVERVAQAVTETRGFLAVGFNRRFSAHARAVRRAFERRTGALSIHYAVAAGPPPAGSWIDDPQVGGGRVVGEVCHFVDLCAYLVGAPPSTVYARRLGRDPARDDSLVATLGFADGSNAMIEYLARAGAELPKERFEVSADGRTASCSNYRVTTASGEKELRTFNQDKGQAAELEQVLAAVRAGRPSPFTLFELVSVSRATFAMLESAATGREIRLHG
jgi:predicted dehydrogenase/threonine dehydrogenase-like Zn-dependent dehydrogenase